MQANRILLVFLASAALMVCSAQTTADDPFIWLEQAHSARAMLWVEAENAKTSEALERNPVFHDLFNEARLIAEAQDRIPEPSIVANQVFNFWQDAEHEHGIWRETSRRDFETAAPHWRTVLDLDALSKSQNANWFWKGAICQEPRQQRCMVALSDGGEDAVTLREFDLPKAGFVQGGFALPSGKQDIAWQDADTLLVSSSSASSETSPSMRPSRSFADQRMMSASLPSRSMTAPATAPCSFSVRCRSSSSSFIS
jgi:prolyl oligopeptidase